jgi:hypothetical protein
MAERVRRWRAVLVAGFMSLLSLSVAARTRDHDPHPETEQAQRPDAVSAGSEVTPMEPFPPGRAGNLAMMMAEHIVTREALRQAVPPPGIESQPSTRQIRRERRF